MTLGPWPVSRAVLLFPAGARSVYHQLFMSSLLMDLKYKKLFALRFAKVSRAFPSVLMINKLVT